MGMMAIRLAVNVEIEIGRYAHDIGHQQKCALGREIAYDAINHRPPIVEDNASALESAPTRRPPVIYF